MELTGEAVPRKAKMVGKVSLWGVPAGHFSTLYDSRIGRTDWWGIAVQALLPLVAGTVTWKLGAKIVDVGGVVSSISIATGLPFTMAAFLFQLRTILDNDKRLGEDDFAFVDGCMVNTLWAILRGAILAIYLIVCGAGKWIGYDSYRPTLTRIAVAGTVHFLLVTGICLKRFRRAYERIAIKRP